MSRIFQALAKTTSDAAELARRFPANPTPADNDGDADQQHSDQPPPAELRPPPLRMPRVVEWRPPGLRREAAAVENKPPTPQPEIEPAAEQPPAQASEDESGGETDKTETGLLVRLPRPTTPPAVIRKLPVKAAAGRPILPFDLGDSVVNEGYRKIRTQLLQAPTEPRVIVVSSPSQGDGKTLTSINLAGALALKHDVQCVLVDADLRRGDIATSCGLPEGPGLGDYLSGRCRIEDALIRVDQLPNLFIITSGEYRTNPVELLDSARWHTLIENLRQRFRFVILDVPPMGSLADYDLVEAASDGVILVVRQDHTTRSAVQSALQAIPPAKRLGIVMNAADTPAYARRGGYGDYRNDYTIQAGR